MLVEDKVLFAEPEVKGYVDASISAASKKGVLTFVYRDVMVTVSRSDDSPFIVLYLEERRRRADLAAATANFNLTARQVSIVRLLSRGLRIADIAEELSLSHSTVADHVKRLLAKTHTKNRAALLACLLGYNPPSKSGMGNVFSHFYT